jgi:hypothetical protein
MPTKITAKPDSVLLSFKFLGTSLVGSLTMALVSTFAPVPAQIAVLGSCVSILSGLFVSYVEQEDTRERRRAELLETLRIPMTLAPEHEIFEQYNRVTNAILDLSTQTDSVLREYALLKLASISEQIRALASGRIEFTTTETWRTVYQQLLRRPGLKFYKSVAWVKTKEYWQDQPGKQDMRLNFELVKLGLEIERIVILRGDLWPVDEAMPASAIRPWIEEQHERGIKVSVVRESEVGSERDLLSDVGIYGDRATGVEELDEESRPLRFTLFFDKQNIALAKDRWARLSLYATPYADVLNSAGRRRPKATKER